MAIVARFVPDGTNAVAASRVAMVPDMSPEMPCMPPVPSNDIPSMPMAAMDTVPVVNA